MSLTTPVPDFKTVFENNAAFVWRSLRYLGVREADLSDQSQEVFMVVHRKLASFEERSSVRTWVYGICLRVASDYRRRAHLRRETVTESPPEQTYDAPQEDQISARRDRDLLLRCLDDLDDTQREVFVLYEIECLEMKEICQIMTCPLQTGYSRLRAARARVRQGFESAGSGRGQRGS